MIVKAYYSGAAHIEHLDIECTDRNTVKQIIDQARRDGYFLRYTTEDGGMCIPWSHVEYIEIGV